MNTSPFNMWEAKCEECDIEMMPNVSKITQTTDQILKTKMITRIESFICPECGAEKTKTYEETFEPYD